MSDNTQLPTGTGGDTVRDIDRAGIKTQVVILDMGGQAGPESLATGTVPVSAASLPLPSGAATSAKQDTIITALGSPLQAGGTVVANAGTNLNTSALLLDATFTGRVNTQGQKAMAASTPVVIASDQTAVPVSGTVTTTPPANASTNLAQVGGVNVSTGTGASGTGIPRVTVSSDSQVKVWDGTTNTTVKAASTASVAADTALVVALNPQGPSLFGVTVGGGATASTATVKAASTAAATTDTAVVMALNPQGPSLIGYTTGAGTTASVATVKAASVQPVASDTSLVVTMSPVQAIPVGSTSGGNSSSATLAANATFTGTSQPAAVNAVAITVEVMSDQSGTLQVQESGDAGVNYDYITPWAYTGGVSLSVQLTLTAATFRVVFINGPVAQTSFRLATIMRAVGASGDVQAYRDPVDGALTRAQMVQGRLLGPTVGGGSTYNAATVKASGAPATFADSALVVAVSPNSPMPENASDRVIQFLLSQLLAQSQAANANLGQGFIPQETPAFLGGF